MNVKIEKKKCKIVSADFSSKTSEWTEPTLSDAIHIASVDVVHLKKYICTTFFKLLNAWG